MSKKRDVLHLIDGSGYIFRAYYGIRPLSTRDGLPTHAVVGFIRMLVKLLREESPYLLGIAFDAGERTFRHDMYPAYKASREARPEDLTPQIPLIHELVAAMDIPVLMQEGWEADDILATLTRQAVDHGLDVVLVTADKDLMQLVGPHVHMFDPMHQRRYDRAAVIEKFGVPPEHVADVLALAGDTSDNIPGVPKVGLKSAAKLVMQFGDVEAVIVGLQGQAKRKVYEENVVAQAELARLCRRLTELDAHAPFTLDTDRLRYRPPVAEQLAPFLRRIEAHSLLRDFRFDAAPAARREASGAASGEADAGAPPGEHGGPEGSHGHGDARDRTGHAAATGDVGSGPHAAAKPPLPGSPIDRAAYVTILTHAALDAELAAAAHAGRLSVDLETTSLDPNRADIVGFALAVPGRAACYVPVAHHYLGVPKQLPVAEVIAKVRLVLEDPAIRKVGQHLKYDWVVLARAGVALRGIADDAMLAAYVLDPARASYGLDALARECLGHQNIAYSELTGTGKQRIGFEQVPVETAATYAAEDADVALRLCDHLASKVDEQHLTHLYRELEVPLVPVLAAMERHGIGVDGEHLRVLGQEFNRRLQALEAEAHAMIGSPINLGSPKQLAHLFFEKLGYPPVKRTKTGFSTDQEVLETLARSYPLPKVILEHRLLAKLKSTYVDALPKMINPETGRVHTSFNQTGTATGRLSSSDPNLQNIPIRSEDGRRIRAAFVAPPGRELISADYSQVELRLVAHMSQDAAFVEAFRRNEDIHQRTAREILANGGEPDKEMRRRAKAINFGILYGLSEFGLARQLNIPRAEAHAYIAAYFARYPSIRHLLDRSIESGRERGYVATIAGRRRYLPNLNSQNGTLRQAAERIAMNTPIQGSAADMIKQAMLRVDTALRTEKLAARLLLQVHDELVVEAPVAERAAVTDLLRREMSEVMQLSVPLVVDVGYGANWQAAHP